MIVNVCINRISVSFHQYIFYSIEIDETHMVDMWVVVGDNPDTDHAFRNHYMMAEHDNPASNLEK